VSEASQPQLPAWVYKRDGRLVPFDADRLSQALFAAAEALGRPDAFLARELTDGILHFLAREHGSAIPTTAQIAELAATVVRELGQASLAQAYAEGNRHRLRHTGPPSPRPAAAGTTGTTQVAGSRMSFEFSLADSPEAVRQACLREYGLRAMFGRDLAAAHHDGLLTLSGLESAQQLAGCVFDPAGRGSLTSSKTGPTPPSGRSGVLVQALLHTRRLAGNFLAIDGPEYALTPFASARDLAKNSGELLAGLEAADLLAVINLNAAQPPAWAEEQPEGPLFAEPRRSPSAHLHEYRGVLLEQLLRPPASSRVRFDWHLTEHDFSGEGAGARLARLARLALDSALSFVFDRPGRPVALAEGLDRRCPGALQVVGLHLPRLLDMPGVRGAPEAFLQKIASLARMAVSAGAQKREYLRRHDRGREQLAREFLLDRARLVVVPIGLDAAVRGLAGQGIAAGAKGLEMGQQIVASLLANLRQAAVPANLDVVVDGTCASRAAADRGFALADADSVGWAALEQVAGLTPWDPSATPRDQLRAAGALHGVAEAGTAAVLLPPQATPEIDELLDLLAFACKQTEIVRLRFLRVPDRQAQLAW